MRNPAELENSILRNLLARTTRAYEEEMRALAAAKELAEITLASIADGVITADPDGRVVYLNPRAEELTGWPAGEARGRPLDEVFRLVADEAGEAAEGQATTVRHGAGNRASLMRRDGERVAVESSRSPIGDGGERELGTVIVVQDVSERRLLSLHLAHQATHDGLTGLLNRQAFDARLRRALEDTRAHGERFTLVYLDLDQFKVVNDTCGHFAGDELIRRVARLVQEAAGDRGVAARLGGDEFALLLPHRLAEAEPVVAALHRRLQTFRFVWREQSFAVGASIGVVPVGRRFESVGHLLSAADHACYVAKDKGRNRVQRFLPEEDEFVRRYGEMAWVVRIQSTLDEDRFRLYAQPIRALAAGGRRGHRGQAGYEVLLRMEDEDGQLQQTSDFIHAAERYGLMRSLDRWVLAHSLDLVAGSLAGGRLAPGEGGAEPLLWINLSGVSVGDEAFLEFVRQRLAAAPGMASRICFEFTETAAVDNLAQARRMIGELSALGCRFALDDFGTGTSSFGHLRELAVDYLKIDGSFVHDMVADAVDREMVESIHRVARLLGIRTVAEGVTNRPTFELLREIGVDLAQGNWLAPPRPLTEVTAEGG